MEKTVTLVFGLIISFLGFLIVWVVYYFWKMRNRSDLDYPISVKFPQRVAEEKRKHPRIDIHWPVSMETSGGTMLGEVKDISIGGAFICCEKPLPVGEVFRLTMIGPDNEPVIATAKVVWSNVNVPKEKVVNRGMGVQFIKMSDRHIQLVKQLFRESN